MFLKKTGRFLPPKAAYIHIPFCISKCHYCEFNSYPGMESLFDGYADAVIREINRYSCNGLNSVYFGGGTPTVLSAKALLKILAAIDKRLHILPDTEVTIEANPGTVDDQKLSELFNSGFNRISIGVQSFNDKLLTCIGRIHTVQQAVSAYQSARKAGFSNVSIDLIFALPQQTINLWRETLEKAISLNPEHISLYELSIEKGTQFARWRADGKLELPDEDLQLEMYELAIEMMKSNGYEHYEVSNFARPGFRSRHNQVYWRNEPYYGFGAGAVSYIEGCRARRLGKPEQYIDAVKNNQSVIEFSECLNEQDYISETVILGLRMLDGIDIARFEHYTGHNILSEFRIQIAKLTERGLLEIKAGFLKVTHMGFLMLNDVSQEFLCGNF